MNHRVGIFVNCGDRICLSQYRTATITTSATRPAHVTGLATRAKSPTLPPLRSGYAEVEPHPPSKATWAAIDPGHGTLPRRGIEPLARHRTRDSRTPNPGVLTTAAALRSLASGARHHDDGRPRSLR